MMDGLEGRPELNTRIEDGLTKASPKRHGFFLKNIFGPEQPLTRLIMTFLKRGLEKYPQTDF